MMAIILFYTPILNGDELQFLGMAKRNPKTNLSSGKTLTYGRNSQPKGQDIDIVVVRENTHKIEDAVN